MPFVLERFSVHGGGYLKDTEVGFSERLTSLLGARGTGKTTLLLLLAYVLELPLTPKQESLVKNNLAGGRVRLEVKVAHGARYVLARSYGQARTSIFNEQEQPVHLTAQSDLFAVDFYSHDQIGEIADDDDAQLALLDRLIGAEMETVQQEIAEAQKALAESTAALLQEHASHESLESDAGEAKDLKQRLDGMVQSGHSADGENVKTAHQHHLLRKRERTALASAQTAVTKTRKLLSDVATTARGELGRCVSADLLTGPNGAILGAVDAELRTLLDHVESALKRVQTLTDATEESIAEQQAELDLVHAKQEEEYSAITAKQDEENASAVQRIQLQERYAAIMTAPERLAASSKEWEGNRKARRAILSMLRRLRARRSHLRQEMATRVNDLLKDEVRIVLKEEENRGAYQTAIGEALKGAVNHHVAVAKLLAKIPPETLTAIVEARDTATLNNQTGIKPDQANAIFDALGKWPHLFAVEDAIIDDAAQIQLMDGDWQSVKEVSDGQRITAILPLVLLESDRPLIVDQPEDNLDNQFIYERVVKMGILHAKERRQLLLATHSANIAVLGESEHLLVAAKVARKLGKVTQAKDLGEALRLLEGGKEALLRRVKRYGL